MPKITKTIIDKTEPAEADVYLWCSEVPGFGVRVRPSGRKVYVVRYRTQDGQQRKQNVARCSDVTPDRARDMARAIFGKVAAGQDPARDKQDARESATMQDLRDAYMTRHAEPFKKPKSIANDECRWRLQILPALGKKKVRAVTKNDITDLMGGLARQPAVANQVLMLLSKAFNLAEDWGMRDTNTNPCRGIKKFKLAERETILDTDDIERLQGALDDLVAEGRISHGAACLVRLLLLTGCRLTEIMHAERAWVDEARMLLSLPDTKTGQRRIPLSAAAMDVIRSLPDGKWLIPGKKVGEHMVNPHGPWAIIKAAAKLPPKLRIHDLRHTVGSLGHANGLSQLEIAKLLGHRQLSTTERYLHGVKQHAERSADKIAELVKPRLRLVDPQAA